MCVNHCDNEKLVVFKKKKNFLFVLFKLCYDGH